MKHDSNELFYTMKSVKKKNGRGIIRDGFFSHVSERLENFGFQYVIFFFSKFEKNLFLFQIEKIGFFSKNNIVQLHTVI
jgi:hypothetical protein